MKVFMIGGTGLLGSEAAKELISRGHEVSSIAQVILHGLNVIERRSPIHLPAREDGRGQQWNLSGN